MNYDAYEEVKPKSSLLPGCLIGCLASVFLLMAVVAVGGWLAFKKGPGIVAQAVRQGMVEGLKETDLPQDQQRRIVEQLDRVVNAVKAGSVSIEDFESTAEEFAESPLIGLIVVAALEAKYINDSGLDQDEKAAAELTIRRIMRGVVEKKLDLEQLSGAMEIIAVQTGENSWRLKHNISDDELREFIAKCNEVADAAEIEIDPEPVDIADEVRLLVDRLLGESTSPEVLLPASEAP